MYCENCLFYEKGVDCNCTGCFYYRYRIMRQVVSYDPQRDIMAVDPTGFADLVKANQTNSIDGLAQATEGISNGIEDPRSIGTRPDDVFEAMQAQKAASEYVPDGGTS